MSAQAARQRVAVIFGGESVEHEVSVISAQQVMAALDQDRYRVVPVYVSKEGAWFTGSQLMRLESFRDLERLKATAEPALLSLDPGRPGLHRHRGGPWGGWGRREPIDLAFPVLHGGSGEDGGVQGLLEVAGLPYVGSGVAASALGMNKALAKLVVGAAGVPTLDHLLVDRERLAAEPEAVLVEAEARFGYPLFVKPTGLGSSIAVGRAGDRDELAGRLDLAARYDSRLLVEPAQDGVVEVNCAVLGDGRQARPSVCEQPLSEGVLTYEDKYLAGGKGKGMQSSRRLIPAPIGDELTRSVQELAVRAFRAVGAVGVARIDFFADAGRGQVLFNEINTMPGSLAFYLWEPAGLSFPGLLEELIELAWARHGDRCRSLRSIPTWLLSAPAEGAKLAAGGGGMTAR